MTLRSPRGHVSVVTCMNAHCRQTCPLVAEKLRDALTGLGPAGRQVAVLVVSVDPEGDTTGAVRRFSRIHGMLHRWHYLMGTRPKLARLWCAYYIHAAPQNAQPSIKQAHTSAIYLIDREGRERVLLTGNPDEVMLSPDLRILAGLPVTSPAEAAPAPEKGHRAPGFVLASLGGWSLSLSTLRGRVVLLNVWATWCTACRTEMPRLASWYRTLHRRGLIVLGVDQQEDRSTVRSFAQRYHVRYPILLDGGGDVSARYNVVGLPTSFLIDRQGIIRSVHIGIISPAYLREQVMPALQERARG